MAQTARFGLERFGPEGNISQNGYKFTLKDREIIDTLLWTLFNHNHSEASSTPIGDPNLPVLTEGAGGNLFAGASLYYKVSFRDENGNETAASPEQSIVLPGALLAPGVPQLASFPTGGALTAGTYRYALSFYQSGAETNAPRTNSITVSGATSRIVITLPTLPTGALGWRIYRQAPGETNYFLLATVAGGATPPTSYTDDGSVIPTFTINRPNQNTTNSGGSVVIEINSQDLPLDPRIRSWRIYRTSISGIYAANSLVATVTSTTTEGGSDLVTTYTDTGAGLAAGTPLNISSIPVGVPQIDAGNAFLAGSDPLPKELAPREVSTWCGRADAPDTTTPVGLQSRTYGKTVLESDRYIERFDWYFIDPPSGLGGGNTLEFVLSDGTTDVSLLVNTDGEFYSWVSSQTDSGEIEAEDVVGADGTTVSDGLASNQVVQQLTAQNHDVVWSQALDGGDYIARFYVRDVGQNNGTLLLRVQTDAPLTLADTTVTSPGPEFYDPPEEVGFTVPPGGATIEFVVRKTDANVNNFRVDRIEFEYQNPHFLEGNEMTMAVVKTGSFWGGDKASFTVWS